VTGRILLIRHTRLAVAPGICYGQTDLPLAPTFAAEAADVLARMPWKPTEIWTSPAVRCVRLADAFGIPAGSIRVDPRLLELDFGEWENRPWESFRSPRSEAWARDPLDVRPPGGETATELHLRVGKARAEILARAGAEENPRIAVITHAGVIRSWRAHASGRGLMEFFGEPVPYGEPVGLC
jgi:alpha-ribazole phosphatase